MTQNTNRGTAADAAKALGKHRSAIYKYIDQTRGMNPHPLGMESDSSGITLDIDKTRAYAEAKRPGRNRKNPEANA